jgi:hypothetical protein
MNEPAPNGRSEVPPALRARIEHDLQPVTPLASPARRTLPFIPIAFAQLVAAVLVFGLRIDSPQLGFGLTWGASVLQLLLSLSLIVLALREAIPGTTLSRQALVVSFGAGLVTVLAITWWTWSASPTTIEPRANTVVWRICLGSTILLALPVLALAGWLVAHAFPLRPRLAGALCGLAAGLMADAGWRLFCHYSDPTHVFGAHTLAILITTATGSLLCGQWLTRPRT